LPGVAGEKGAAGLKVGIENGLKSTQYVSACIDDRHAFQLGFKFWLAFNDLLPPVIRAVRGFTNFTIKKHILLLCMYDSSQWH